ncbi:MAG: lasso peptide biosynthesis PqqD family chaperone [Methylobacter sp.]
MKLLTIDTQIFQNPELVAANMDGDLVMMSIERGEYFGIGGVGPRIWELLAEPNTIGQLVDAICAEYDINETTCQADIIAFVEQLLTNELVCLA